MKVAYIFISNLSHRILSTMILPQLEEDRHGVQPVAMFFFGDNTFMLVKGNAVAERLKKIREKNNMLLITCDQSVYEREIDKSLVEGTQIGCFPEFYRELEKSGVHQIITL